MKNIAAFNKGHYLMRQVIALVLSSAFILMSLDAVEQKRDDKALMEAIKQNNASQVLAMLDRGANPNAIERTGSDETVWSSFSRRIRGLVLHKGKRAQAKSTALLVLCQPRRDANGNRVAPVENATILQALLDSGANVNATDRNEYSALSYAMAYGDWATARSLVEHGADVDCRGLDGEPLLFAAVMQPDLLRLLLQKGANAETRSANGCTPLMVASEYNLVKSAKILLAYGAHPDAADAYGDTALKYATADYAKECIRLLKTAGAKS